MKNNLFLRIFEEEFQFHLMRSDGVDSVHTLLAFSSCVLVSGTGYVIQPLSIQFNNRSLHYRY
jgi:hypothetical protein